MRFDLICPNKISSGGFVLGMERAALGNALSTYANLVLLQARTGVDTAYPQLLTTPIPDVLSFSSMPELVINGDAGRFDFPALLSFTETLDLWINCNGSRGRLSDDLRHVADLSELNEVSDSIVVASCRTDFLEMEALETTLKDFCARRNGVVISRAFWPQYMSSRFDHAGPLRAKMTVRRDDDARERRGIQSHRRNIALHVRGGDYELWHGGRYCFSQETNWAVLKALAARWPDARFHIFTHLPLGDMGALSGLDVSTAPDASGTADFLSMTQCDVIVGPPSTFGTWAAFLGATKRLILTQDRISCLCAGEDPEMFLTEIERPTFSYLPGVDGPI